ncbi:MAG: ATP-binding protein [bacterium]
MSMHLPVPTPDPDYLSVLAALNRMPDKAAKHLKSAFALLTERAATTLAVSRANIWLFTDSSRTILHCIDSYNFKTRLHSAEGELHAAEVPNYINALQQERVIRADDAMSDPRTAEFSERYLSKHNIRSMLDAPIRQNGEVVGVICLEQTGEKREWKDAEASFVATLSDFATMALLSHEKDLAETALIQAQKMESLGRLAGGIAHDFNNILMVLSGAVDTLQISGAEPELRGRMLALMSDACERAQNLTRNLLAFGGKQNLEFQQLSTHKLIHAIEGLTTGIIREDIQVHFVIGHEPYWFEGDQTQLEQVVLNLMINAMDAMPEGGKLTIEALPPDHNGLVGLAVVDTGGGIPQECLDKIFEPFFSTKGKQGTGLGLSISTGIVQQHNGRLECVSSSAQGTRFELKVPAIPAHQLISKTTVPDTSVQTQRGRMRILLVEDEVSVRDIVSQMLTALGYEVMVALSAGHGLSILAQKNIDLVVSDVIMPDMRGPDLYKSALSKQPDLKALFVSGYSEELTTELTANSANVGYLSKPFTLAQLRAALEQLADVQSAD